MQQQHAWEFFRAGGVDQVVIRTGQDIAHIGELDQKLWVALACPTRGIEFDSDTLDLIDEDKDGRIRPPELIAACQWAVARVRDPQVLADGGDPNSYAKHCGGYGGEQSRGEPAVVTRGRRRERARW